MLITQPARADLWGASEPLAERVEAIFWEHGRRYGARRIQAQLQAEGHRVGRHRVRDLMREQGLQAIQPRSFVPRTTSLPAQRPHESQLVMGARLSPRA